MRILVYTDVLTFTVTVAIPLSVCTANDWTIGNKLEPRVTRKRRNVDVAGPVRNGLATVYVSNFTAANS